jgi:glycosyltransferase involved in cell wall biosynthesis
MTRVLYVLPELSEKQTTAAQVRAAELLPRLNTNFELTILTFNSMANDNKGFGALNIIKIPKPKISNISLAIATLMNKPRAFSRFYNSLTRDALIDILQKYQPEIVHFDGFAMLGFIHVVKTIIPKCKVVAHIHDAQSARMERYTRMGSLANRFQKGMEYRKSLRFERQQLGDADLVLVDSDEDRNYLCKQIGRNIVCTLPLGFNPDLFSSKGKVEDIVQPAIVYSGSMKADQSIDAAVFLVHEVMPAVWEQIPDAHLYIVGGSPTDEILALSSSRIHITGYVEDLAPYLRACKVYACPLRLGSGMRTRVVEALACGTSMVVTSMAVRGLTKTSQDGPWVVADDAVSFSKAIVNTLNETGSVFGERAEMYANDRFSWSSISTQLSAYYKEILN